MLLTIRVVFTILFSAFVLWSQTLDDGSNSSPVAAESEQLTIPVLVGFTSTPAEKPKTQFSLKLNLPQLIADVGNPVLARNLALSFDPQNPASQPTPPRPKAITYSSGYSERAKIHKYASIATLPLFVAEAIVGQKLVNRTVSKEDSLRSVHSGLAAGIGILFGINSITGVWNMWEARKDPNGRGKRLFHGILMLAADAGFVATAALAPHHEDSGGVRRTGDASTHKAAAYASFGVATVGYVYMLFAR